MENASKALIIAGAILLAILIISLGILIYNQAAGIANGNAMSEVEITQLNTQFTQYEGRQSGTTVRSLLQKVISNNLNADDSSKKVIVKDHSDATILGENDTELPTDEVSTSGTYTVSFVYGNSGASDAGLVTEIHLD